MANSAFLPIDPQNVYGSPGAMLLNPSDLYQTNPSTRSLTVPNTTPSGYVGPLANVTAFGRPFSFYLGLILVLLLIKYASEHEGVNLETSYIHVGIINFVIIAIAAKLGDLTLKWFLNIVPVPGLTDIANA